MSSAAPHAPPVVEACLRRAEEALGQGRWADAVEAIAAGAVADIQQFQQAYLRDAAAAAGLAAMYARAFIGAGVEPRTLPVRRSPERVRIAYVLSSVVEGQSGSATIARLATFHDPRCYDVHVIVTEELFRREPATAFLALPEGRSEVLGSATMADLRAHARVHVVEPRGSLLDGAIAAARLAQGLELDVAVFMASPACPVQAGMAFARIAPVQVNLNIGVPLPIRGIDAVIYNNPLRQAADGDALAAMGMNVLGVPYSGADVAKGLETSVADRGALGVPPGAVMLGSAANRLPDRMLAGTFAADLGRFLAAHAGVWWVGIGPGRFAPVREALVQAGGAEVLRRVLFVGPQADIRPVVRACDVYLNEYPEGGATTVAEAMGCGVPVVAYAAGSRHAEAIGACLVGSDAAGDRASYWALVKRLTSDGIERRAVGARQRARALALYDFPRVCAAYEHAIGRARAAVLDSGPSV